ncbi:MAG TPA: zinc-ribbon and DUF3426 domain-containing protein [Rhodanobacteraceae bacterium]|nr:zinc-ribbon and DUF3426 domain-containing protein [Rhodanobacteraceae bacterium]
MIASKLAPTMVVMYAQCPECLTIFTLDATTIAQARGSVACGHCGASFDSLATLAEDLPPEPFDTLPLHPSSPAPPVLMMAVFRPQPSQQGLFEDAAKAATATPSFARTRRVARPRHALRWALGCLLLGLCLAGQLAWAQRGDLLADARTGPLLRQACARLHCALPLQSAPEQLQLLSRDVRPHPSVPGALLISATVRNAATFTQPFPVLSITLSDLDDNRIAMRRFRPADYVHDARTRAAGLAPGATAALVFEVADPGKDAVAFAFDFQ